MKLPVEQPDECDREAIRKLLLALCVCKKGNSDDLGKYVLACRAEAGNAKAKEMLAHLNDICSAFFRFIEGCDIPGEIQLLCADYIDFRASLLETV